MPTSSKGFFGVLVLSCLGLLAACGQGSSSKSTQAAGSPGGSQSAPAGSSKDPFSSLLGKGPGGSTTAAGSPATASSASEMKTMADEMDKLAGSAPGSQSGVLKDLSQWAKTAFGNYQSLTPGLSFSALASWAARQKAERDRLLALAEKARQAEMAVIAEAIEDLANRRDVFVAGKTMKNGGFRFAYFRDANQVAPYLNGYTFRGVAFQVYEKPQKIASDTANTKLSHCAHSATEDGQQAWVFYVNTGGCGGNIALPDLGYISANPTGRTSRELYLTVRLVDNNGNGSSDFVDTFVIAGKQNFEAFLPALIFHKYGYSGTPIGYVN